MASVVFKVALSIALMTAATVYLSRRRRITLPLAALSVGGMDLTPVAVLTWCFGFAAIAGLIGLSPAFGAFFAGLLVSSSFQRKMVRESARPIQSVLLMVFFLSIGLLIDLRYLWDNLALVILLWLFVAVFKTALNTGVLRFMGKPWQRAFLSSLFLAQLGEFSFVLGAAAIDRQVIDSEIHRMIVAITVLSLVTSPLWLNSARWLHHRAARRPESLSALLRLIYFREWRLTRRLSSALAAATRVTYARMRADLAREAPSADGIEQTTEQLQSGSEPLALPAPDAKKSAHRDDA